MITHTTSAADEYVLDTIWRTHAGDFDIFGSWMQGCGGSVLTTCGVPSLDPVNSGFLPCTVLYGACTSKSTCRYERGAMVQCPDLKWHDPCQEDLSEVDRHIHLLQQPRVHSWPIGLPSFRTRELMSIAFSPFFCLHEVLRGVCHWYAHLNTRTRSFRDPFALRNPQAILVEP